MKPFYSTPRPTRGHHFEDLLICPQRAWLHYFGNPEDQSPDPAYLRSLQQEGLDLEQSMYDQLFPDAQRIPQRGKAEERLRLTLDAIRSGVPIILQGYVKTEDGVGVLDILERVNSDEHGNHLYRVGEIKRSASLKTSHVMQTSWYVELLERLLGYQQSHDACFFLHTSERNIVDLRSIQPEYETAKTELRALRESTIPPGPYLNKICPTCHWRSLCMPELIETQHISLIPGISRQQANALREMGTTSWTAVKDTADSILETVGLGPYEIEQIRAAVRHLEQGTPPLRQSLRPDVFQDLQIVVLEFHDIAGQRQAGRPLVPSAIHFENGAGRTERIDVQLVDDVPTADITALMDGSKLGFYSLTDLGAFKRLAHQAGFSKVNSLDIFAIIDGFIHSPVPGLEVESLHSHVTGQPSGHLSGTERVAAIREIVNWVSGSL